MPKLELWTFGDVMEHLLDDFDGGLDFGTKRRVRLAIAEAYRQITVERKWNYFRTRGRVTTVAPQSTGTVVYDHTGGTNERELTLTGATWPAWAALGAVLLNQRRYEVATRVSDTVLTLSVSSNPGEDIATGIEYTLFQDTYVLPTDFGALAGLVDLERDFAPTYALDADWLGWQRFNQTPNWPQAFTIMGSPEYHGQKVIRFAPPPDAVRVYDYVYRRRARPLSIDDYHEGKVSATAGSTTITGTSGVNWRSDLVGTVIRFADADNVNPENLYGEQPFQIERIVTSIDAGANTLEVDAVMPESFSQRNYRMSDPIDLDDIMFPAFLKLCEAQQGVVRVFVDRSSKDDDLQERLAERRRERRARLEEYQEALRRAAAADNVTYDVNSPLGGYMGPVRLRDFKASGSL